MNVVNLNALAVKRHAVEYDGETHDVRTMTQRIANVIQAAEMELDGTARLAGFHDAIALILPTMKREIIEGLEASMIKAIFELSEDQIRVVQEAAAAPKEDSPAPSRKKSPRRALTSSGAS